MFDWSFRALIIILLATSPIAAMAAQDYSSDEIIIEYKTSSQFALRNNSEQVQDLNQMLADNYGVNVIAKQELKQLKHTNKILSLNNSKLAVLTVDAHEQDIASLVEQIKGLSSNGLTVAAAYPNYIFEVSASPNDALYPSQWALDSINVEGAWGDAWEQSGEGAVVAVIDTGVDYNHPDLVDNIWTNEDEIPNNKIDDDGNGYIDDVRGYDFVADGVNCAKNEDCSGRDAKPNDYHGHGTHASGIIAASRENNIGVTGVAPQAKIMPLRAAFATSKSAFLKSSDVYDAIAYAIDNGADVVSMSFAGENLGVLSSIISRADQAGVVMVAAAGNHDSSTPLYPAALPEVISVGAIDHHGDKASFSNYGDWIDIAAPGVQIYSTLPGSQYGVKSGTSMAAPLVAGVAALIKGKNQVGTLSAATIRQRIINASIQSNFPQLTTGTFVGMLNAMIEHPLEVDMLDIPDSAMIGDPVKLNGSGSHYGHNIVAYEWNSNLDGFLSSESEFMTASLSQGNHRISFRIQNEVGEWSAKVYRNINVSDQAISIANNDYELKIIKNKKRLKAHIISPGKSAIRQFAWDSDRDGFISNRPIISKKQLTKGVHIISLKAQDIDGMWSEVTQVVVRIR